MATEYLHTLPSTEYILTIVSLVSVRGLSSYGQTTVRYDNATLSSLIASSDVVTAREVDLNGGTDESKQV